MNSAFWLCSGSCHQWFTITSGTITLTTVPGSRRVAPHLLEHRPGQVAERRLHDVQRDLEPGVEPRGLELVRRLGVEVEVDRPGDAGVERLRVVHRADREVVHAGQEHQRHGAVRDQRLRVDPAHALVRDHDGHVGDHHVRDPQQRRLEPHEVRPSQHVGGQSPTRRARARPGSRRRAGRDPSTRWSGGRSPVRLPAPAAASGGAPAPAKRRPCLRELGGTEAPRGERPQRARAERPDVAERLGDRGVDVADQQHDVGLSRSRPTRSVPRCTAERTHV